MTGIVFFQVDHSAPVDAMREQLRDILRECPAWDGRDYGLAVTDSTPNTMEVRALVTAKDADDIWTVRVTVREQMIRWLTEEHPYALPASTRRTRRCHRATPTASHHARTATAPTSHHGRARAEADSRTGPGGG